MNKLFIINNRFVIKFFYWIIIQECAKILYWNLSEFKNSIIENRDINIFKYFDNKQI